MTAVRRLCSLALATTVAVALPGAIANADTSDISINTGSGWVHDSTTPLFDVSRLAPGLGQTATLLVRNDTTSAGALALSATDITEYENGCMHSEAVVDTTCGPLEGELGHELLFSVYLDPENDGTFEPTPRWSGTLYDLATPPSLVTGLPGGRVAGLRVDMTLPSSSGNETQTDNVDFAFRLTLAGAGLPASTGTSAGSVDVKGIKVTRDPQTGVLHDITSQLPFTGTPADRLVAAALWMLVAGAALTLLGATRRRRRPPAAD
jgi:hypothetical protein